MSIRLTMHLLAAIACMAALIASAAFEHNGDTQHAGLYLLWAIFFLLLQIRVEVIK